MYFLCLAIHNQINPWYFFVQKMMDNTVDVEDFLNVLLSDLGFAEEREGELDNNSQDF